MTAISLAPAWVDDDLGYSDFYARYHQALTSYLRMAFRDADVEAVAQETFCRALAHWTEVRSMTAPWPWLAVTARNLARNNIRDEQASRPAGLDVFDPATCAREDVAGQVEASESLRRLAQSMSVLTPLQRRLLTVMVEEGLTGAQLARRLGMRPGAVRMHLCRMRARLGERFTALGGMLGLGPVALLPSLIRRIARPRRYGVQQAALTAGSTALAVSAAMLSIAVATGGFSGGDTRPAAAAPGAHQVLTASATSSVRPPRSLVAPQARHGATPGAGAAALPLSYRAEVSRTPTKAGTTADVLVRIDTPVGTTSVSAPISQKQPVVPPGPCPQGRC